MLEIQELPQAICQNLYGIFCDLDDTMTTDGKLLDVSYQALWNAYRAGLRVVVVTGRPGGWCDHIARMWPVSAVVGENGAFYFWMEGGKMRRYFVQDSATREQGRARLKLLQKQILQEVPLAAVSSDQQYRESDLAIDFCEDVPPLTQAMQQKILQIFRAAEAQAKISSIHVNGWFGQFDKLSSCKLLMSQLWQANPATAIERSVYCGDSPNDEPMFAAFPHSVGVANVVPWLGAMKSHPRYKTRQRGGEGFAEMVAWILQQRQS